MANELEKLVGEINKLQKEVQGTDYDIEGLLSKTIDKISINYKALQNISAITIANKANDQQVLQTLERTKTEGARIEPDRLTRYRDYNDIVYHIPTIALAIQTYVDNIITPDNMFDEVIKIKLKKNIGSKNVDQVKKVIENYRTLINDLDIESYLEPWVKSLVKNGDAFIEIDYVTKFLKKYKILQESGNESEIFNEYIDVVYKYDSDKKEVIEEPTLNRICRLMSESENDDSQSLDLDTIIDDEKIAVDQIVLTIHDPKHVIILQKYGVILGYLVVEPNLVENKPMDGSSLGSINIERFKGIDNEKIAEELLKKIVDSPIISKKLREIGEENPSYISYIGKLLRAYDKTQQTLTGARVKFIPPERMVTLINETAETKPYGESLLEPMREFAKYLVVSMRAVMLYRFTRAPDLRVFKVEIGIDRDAAKFIENLKREIEQRKFPLNPEGDIDTLTSSLTMFDDIWVPMRNGQQFFEIENIATGDLQSKLDDLKYLTDFVISGLGIPPTYLSTERGEDSRLNLAQMNAMFVKRIVRYQKLVNKSLTELIKKLYRLVYGGNIIAESFSFELQPPVALVAERYSEVYSNVSNLLQSLESVTDPIQKEYLKKRFIPWIDFDEIDDNIKLAAEVDKIEKSSQKGGGTGEEGGEEGGEDLF